jgi:hypothetical protein
MGTLGRKIARLAVIAAVAALGPAAEGCSSSKGSGAAAAASTSLYCSVTVAGVQECFGYSNLTAQEQSAERSACTGEGGTIVPVCPVGNFGCCSTTTAGLDVSECYYAGTAAQAQAACTGTWTSSAAGAGGG